MPAAWHSVAVGAAAFALYLALTPSVAADKDTGEFTLVLATLGLAHPTGYPLYTLLGHAFVVAAHGLGASWARAANAFSALGAAVAIGLVHALAVRLFPARVPSRLAALAALIPVVAFGVNPMWTLEATLAEVNSWHLAWVAGAALAAWSAASALAEPEPAAARLRRRAALWGVVVGVGVVHHATSVFFIVPLTLALAGMAWRRGRDRWALFAAAIAGAIPALLTVGYVAWRAWHPAVVQWPELVAEPRAVFEHLSGGQYRAFLGRFAPSSAQSALLARYTYPWLVCALAGAVGAALAPLAAPRAYRIALAAAVLAQTAACFVYGVPDPATYFLPALMLGLALLPATIAAFGPDRRVAGAIAVASSLGVTAFAVNATHVAVERNQAFERLDTLLHQMWNAIPSGPGFVVWNDDMSFRLRAFQILDGEHPERIVVQPSHLSHAAVRAAFLARYGFDPLQGVEGLLAARPAGGDAAAEQRIVEGVAENLNRHSPLPVFLFLPEIPSVRQLKKAGTPETPAAR